MPVRVGTSGFQYPEWKGTFYPADLPPRKMLAFYAERFGTTEVNSTFRRIPSAPTITRWAGETPADFVFSFKAPQRITHFAKLRGCHELVRTFAAALAAMGAKLGVTLFQLPPGFARDDAVLAGFLAALPVGMRVAFEFRHASWFDDAVFAALRDHCAALCVAESAEIATPAAATAPFGYLRLRREDYAPADLARWAEWVRRQDWREAFVYFKHEERGVGPEFARTFRDRLA